MLPLPQALLIELRVRPDLDSTLPRQVAAPCIENLLITLDSRRRERPKLELDLTEPSLSGLLLGLLLLSANQVSAELRQVRAWLFDLDGQMGLVARIMLLAFIAAWVVPLGSWSNQAKHLHPASTLVIFLAVALSPYA